MTKAQSNITRNASGLSPPQQAAAVYARLVERARSRVAPSPCEWHHVLPRCMGGEGTEEVALTLREHFIAHRLLAKMHPGHAGLAYAVYSMSNAKKGKVGARGYARLKEAALPILAANGRANVESGLLDRIREFPQTKLGQHLNGTARGRANAESGHLDRIRELPQTKAAARATGLAMAANGHMARISALREKPCLWGPVGGSLIEYRSVAAASRATPCFATHVSRVLNGKAKQAHGFTGRWLTTSRIAA